MDSFADFHGVIKERITNPNANNYEPYWWDKELKVILADLPRSIRFIREACTDEELYWLGEIFDDIMEKTRSVDFLDSLRERAERVTNPEWKKDILSDIRDAAAYV